MKRCSLVVLLAVVLAVALPPSAVGAVPPTYLTQWGTPGSGDGQFSLPCGVALDGGGNVYVADRGNNRIQKFTSDGAYLTQWGICGSENGQFNSPYGVAVDGSGNVYVVDQVNCRIQKFTGTGAYLTQWGTPGSGDGQFSWRMCGVAVDVSGNVYVADYDNGRIQKFTGSGTYLTQWGTYAPLGVAVDGTGNVYVTGPSDAIIKFTSDGTYVAQWGLYDSGDGWSYSPSSVAVDGSGNVYVTECTYSDSDGSRVQVFTSSGTYLTQWGTIGSGDGQFGWSFMDAFGVVVDGSGNVYVADGGNNRIQKFGSLPVPTKSTSWGRIKALYRY